MNSKSALLWDAVQGSCETSKLLEVLDRGVVNPSERMDGWTPLHFLCENRSVDSGARSEGLRLLLRAGFDINAVDENEWSALHLLCKNKCGISADLVSSLQQLLAANANVNLKTADSKKSALHFLCENETVSANALETFLKANPNVNDVDKDGNTPLHYLAENTSVNDQMFRSMLAAKANQNLQNHFQSTPTHYICQNSNVTQLMIHDLLMYKANFNIKNNIGNTPVHYICENNTVTINMLKELLSDKHVNVTIPNSLGKLPLDYIPSHKQDCIAFLEKFAAPILHHAGGSVTATAEIGGEDPSDLPEALKKILVAWNASLPPFDSTFYNAISCDAAFEPTYNEVQEVTWRASEATGDSLVLELWEKNLSKWRSCILLAYAALVPPTAWHQYAEQYKRPVPSDIAERFDTVQETWKKFPEQSQRRGRFETLAGVFRP